MFLQKLLRYAPAIVLIIGLSYWLTLPTDTLAIDRNCEPMEVEDQVSALFHPDVFWRDQLDALREARQIQERLQAKAGLEPETTVNKTVTAIERKMDRLSNRAAVEETEAQQKARLDRIEWMTACEVKIAPRVQP